MAIASTVNTVNLSGVTAQNSNYFNFINYSGAQYNVITTGLLSNYLDNNTLLTALYTNINNINKWIAPSYYVAQLPEDMIINIVTGNINTTMSLPFGDISSINVNWGNGLISTYTTAPSNVYSNIGSYSIRISGYATSFGNTAGYIGSNIISSISQWGTIGLTSLSGACSKASNLVSVPSTISPYITDTSYMFNDVTIFNQNISSWNTSNIINMSYMFQTAIAFNKDISPWNTSKVTTMQRMFSGATAFNQNLSTWSVLNLTTAINMFCGCPVFGQTGKYPPFSAPSAPYWGC